MADYFGSALRYPQHFQRFQRLEYTLCVDQERPKSFSVREIIGLLLRGL